MIHLLTIIIIIINVKIFLYYGIQAIELNLELIIYDYLNILIRFYSDLIYKN